MTSKNLVSLLSDIGDVIYEADKHRNAYWWSSPGNASARRSYEKKHTVPTVEWTENGHSYTAAYTVRCSCSNVYARGEYTRDGAKTTLTAIKNSYKRLAAQAGTV